MGRGPRNKVGRNSVTSGGHVTVTVTEPIPCYRSWEGLFYVCLASGNQRRSCYRSRNGNRTCLGQGSPLCDSMGFNSKGSHASAARWSDKARWLGVLPLGAGEAPPGGLRRPGASRARRASRSCLLCFYSSRTGTPSCRSVARLHTKRDACGDVRRVGMCAWAPAVPERGKGTGARETPESCSKSRGCQNIVDLKNRL